MKTLRSYLGDRWVEGSGVMQALVNPATEEPLAQVASEGLDVAAALEHARKKGGPARYGMPLELAPDGDRGAITQPVLVDFHGGKKFIGKEAEDVAVDALAEGSRLLLGAGRAGEAEAWGRRAVARVSRPSYFGGLARLRVGDALRAQGKERLAVEAFEKSIAVNRAVLEASR